MKCLTKDFWKHLDPFKSDEVNEIKKNHELFKRLNKEFTKTVRERVPHKENRC